MEFINIPGSVFSGVIEINTEQYGDVSRSLMPCARAGFCVTDKVVRLNSKQNKILTEEYHKVHKLLTDAIAYEFASCTIERLHLQMVESVNRINKSMQDDKDSSMISVRDFMAGGLEGIIESYAGAKVYQNTPTMEGGFIQIPNIGMSCTSFIELSH